ncbi:unnamed protein product [Eruca vesicaria subsp. sativa]|uniref:PGG domain-containing protein n=1 Tax=Eruca vesicaria subsp. sativa TaxID=29727 RepID=A0ABC8KIP6_ERUVS|nr:unnamed protein product [Eruca vesicaria subsp. sativa]
MILSALITTLTFTGVLQPPGTFKSDGCTRNNTTIQSSLRLVLEDIFGRSSNAGQAVMADRPVHFTLYVAFNAIGFLVSVAMISLLTKGFPLRNWMRLCIISLLSTYLIAIVYIAPNEDVFCVVVLAVSLLVVLRELFLFIKSLCKWIRDTKSN